MASAASVRNHSQSLEVLMPEDRLYFSGTMKPSDSAENLSSLCLHTLYIVFPRGVFNTFHTQSFYPHTMSTFYSPAGNIYDPGAQKQS